jgi:hypothetical protein
MQFLFVKGKQNPTPVLIVRDMLFKKTGEKNISVGIKKFYSWRGFDTPRLCRGYEGIKPESNTL